MHAQYGIPVISIANLDDVLAFLQTGIGDAAALAQYRDKVAAYRDQYGVAPDA